MNIWIVLIYRFRRQHEQLRQVILRVLRPAKSPMPAVPSESQSAAEPIAIDLADNSSIDVCNGVFHGPFCIALIFISTAVDQFYVKCAFLWLKVCFICYICRKKVIIMFR